MSARWRRLWLAAGWGIVIAWIPMSIVFARVLQQADGGDFGMYYAAAEALRFSPHSDIFLQQTLTTTVLAHGGCGSPPLYPYPYQPLLALLLEPLTFIPCQTAAVGWLILSFVIWFGLTALYTLRALRRYGPAQALLAAMTVLFLLPVLSGIGWGQLQLVMVVIMIAGMLLIARGHEYAGGIVLGFGVVLKYFPAILVLYYLLRGRWRAAIGAAVTSVALIVAELFAVGPRLLAKSIGASVNDVRYFASIDQGGHWMNVLPAGAVIGYILAALFVVTVGAITLYQGRRAGHEVVGGGWAITTMLMISPLVWWHYMTLLIPALIACLELVFAQERPLKPSAGWRAVIRTWWPGCLLAISYVLLAVPPVQQVYRITAIGTVLLWLLCGALYLRSAGVRLPARRAPWQRVAPNLPPAEVITAGVTSTG